ncbi:MAG: VIT1/CCC1 transporter family protein [Candidatus Marsarchaeota archaeon]|nr:VIT1/CCC1 transporter family protein [Candidatus Marsarchaeota archaeon]
MKGKKAYKNKIKYFTKLCKVELLHKKIYKELSKSERKRHVKDLLVNLSNQEEEHARLYQILLHGKKVKISSFEMRTKVFLLKVLERIFGLTIFIKLLEYNENFLHAKLDEAILFMKQNMIESKVEIAILKTIGRDERINEAPLLNKLVAHNKTLAHIKDIGLSLNDGLVEVVATTVGIATALQQPILVAVAGLIVAISGALSMAGGTYISTDYETSVSSSIFKNKKKANSPLLSAFYSGVFYVVGAIFPLLPFIIGLHIIIAIMLSIFLTILLLILISILISIITSTSIMKRIVRTLIISLSAVAISIMLGFYARKYLHVSL